MPYNERKDVIMKNIFKKSVDPLDTKIEELKAKIAENGDPNDPDYIRDCKVIDDLLEIKKSEKDSDKESKSKIDPNTVIQAVVGISSILLILNYEKTDIVTSKSMSIAQRMLGK